MSAFNERLRYLREAAGLTQEGLARAAGLSVSTIAKLERGGMDPSWSTVLRLTEALAINVLAFTESKSPPRAPATDPAAAKRPGRKRNDR
jgi:transcriptional regulator with XRE-family HTH domain